jgi:hypothetical protein
MKKTQEFEIYIYADKKNNLMVVRKEILVAHGLATFEIRRLFTLSINIQSIYAYYTNTDIALTKYLFALIKITIKD